MADGSIVIDTKIDSAGLKSSLSDMQGNIKSAVTKMGQTFAGIRDVMQGPIAAVKLVADGIGKVVQVMGELEQEYQKAYKASAILNSTLKATGASAWTSSKQIYDYADSMEVLTGIDGDAIVSMQAVLLGFKNIKGDNFKEASTQILNMATVMKMDLSSAAQAVGKALDDPINGIDALSRQGFRFTDSQKTMLKEMVLAGDTAKAQKIILDELNTTYGGAAVAANTAATGAAAYKKATGDLREEIGRSINETNEPLKAWFATIIQGYADAAKGANDYKSAQKSVDAGIATAEERIIVLKEERKGLEQDLLGFQKTYDLNGKRIYSEAEKDLQRQIDIKTSEILQYQALAKSQENYAKAKASGDEKAAADALKQQGIDEKYIEMRKKILETLNSAKSEYQKLQDVIDIYNTVRWGDGTKLEEDRIAAIDILIQKQKDLNREKGFDRSGIIPKIAVGGVVDFSSIFKNLKEDEKSIQSYFGRIGEAAAVKYTKSFMEALKENTFAGTQAIKKFVGNVAIAFQKSVAIAKTIFSSLWTVFKINPSELIKSLGKVLDIITTFFTSTLGSLPYYADAGLTMIEKFLKGLLDNLPAIQETATNVISYLAEQLASRGPEIAQGAVKILLALALSIIANLPKIVDAALKIGLAILEGLLEALPQLLTGISSILGELVKTIVSVIPLIIVALIKALPDIITAIAGMLPELVLLWATLPYMIQLELIKQLPVIIPAIFNSVLKIFTESLPALYYSIKKTFIEYAILLISTAREMGANIALGIVTGITNVGSIWAYVKTVFTDFINSVLTFFGIHSPSTLFASFGISLIQGLVKGITGEPLWENIKKTFETATNNIKGFFISLLSSIGSTWDGLSNILKKPFTDITGTVNTMSTTIYTTFKSLVSDIDTLWYGLSVILKSPFNVVISAIRNVLDQINRISIDLPFGGGHIGFAIPLPSYLARGTSNFKGGQAFINDQNAGVNGAELVTLPNGSKVATATATEGLLNQGVMSIMQKLSGMLAPSIDSASMGKTITIVNRNESNFYADGRTLARVVYENIDEVAT